MNDLRGIAIVSFGLLVSIMCAAIGIAVWANGLPLHY